MTHGSAATSRRRLIDALTALRLRAGQPSLRAVARSAGVSHTSIAEVFNGKRVPKWEIFASIVENLGGDIEDFRQLWIASVDDSDVARFDSSNSYEGLFAPPKSLQVELVVPRGDIYELHQQLREPGIRNRLYVGTYEDSQLLTKPHVNLALVGPPRSGKTSGVVIPNMLLATGPVVVSGPLADIYQATAQTRACQGRLWHLSLDGQPTLPGCTKLSWSPVDESGNWDRALSIARVMSSSGVSLDAENGGFLRTQVTYFLAPLLHAAAISGRDVFWVLECALGLDGRRLSQARSALHKGSRSANGAADAMLDVMESSEPRTRAQVLSIAAQLLSPYADSTVGSGSEPSIAFEQDDFASSRDTVYVTIRGDDSRSAGAVFAAFMSQIRDAVYRRQRIDDDDDIGDRPSMLWFLIGHEALRSITDLEATLSASSAAGLSVILELQHPKQLMPELLNICDLLIYPGVREPELLNPLKSPPLQSAIAYADGRCTYISYPESGQVPNVPYFGSELMLRVILDSLVWHRNRGDSIPYVPPPRIPEAVADFARGTNFSEPISSLLADIRGLSARRTRSFLQ